MDVTVPRRIRRRETIWAVRFGQGDRNPEEEAWAAPGRQTESQQPKRSDWHRVARNPDGKTHSPGRLQAPRTFWQRSLNRTRLSLGADGCGARSALNLEPSRGRSRSLPHPRQTGAAERPTERGGPGGARLEFSGRGQNTARKTASRAFSWNPKARTARHTERLAPWLRCGGPPGRWTDVRSCRHRRSPTSPGIAATGLAR